MPSIKRHQDFDSTPQKKSVKLVCLNLPGQSNEMGMSTQSYFDRAWKLEKKHFWFQSESTEAVQMDIHPLLSSENPQEEVWDLPEGVLEEGMEQGTHGPDP